MKTQTTETMSLVATLFVTLIGWGYLAVTVGSKLLEPTII
jgi:hypothetical protein